ncbi:MAG: ParB/RepB/Spo0J family partition protein [Lachnospiraceae bacterium]|nr:ParB/RepB/Spo0J family partition protein [Lachnospiraceae bacterium]
MEKTKRHGLGRGLDALIPDTKTESAEVALPEEIKNSVMELDIARVEPDRNQPRKTFDEDELEELADSIKEKGILIPLLVRPQEDYYQIIAGERRWRAARKAGLKKVPVIIRDDMTDQEVVEVQLIENIQRADLNAIDEALAYKRLIEEFGMTQDQVADRVSKSRTTITNSLRLLKLDPRVQKMLIEDIISSGHARTLIPIEDPEKQYEYAQKALDEKWSVRDAEKEVKKLLSNSPSKKGKTKLPDSLSAVYADVENDLKNRLGTKVLILPKDEKSGRVEIEYYSKEELNDLIAKLQSLS